MNPRQRRGLLLLILAALGAVVVFALVSRYVAGIEGQLKPVTTVLRLRQSVAPKTPLTQDMLEEVEIPARWVPRGAMLGRPDVQGQIAAAGLPAGAFLEQGMVEPRPQLQPGQRALTILVDAETGVAGKIGPNSVVDVQATFEGDEGKRPQSEIVVAGARVIDVGRPRTTGGGQGQPDPEQKVPITFAVSVRESLVVTYAESFAKEVRLSLVREGERSNVSAAQRTFTEAGVQAAAASSSPLTPPRSGR
jgi:pilus assembly protein CpaB